MAHQEFGKQPAQRLYTKVLSLIGEVFYTSQTSFWTVITSFIQRYITRAVPGGLKIRVSDDSVTL